jgi:D-glycero-D-manno-heptose 1,7-bisphosphate phosphatase
MDPAIFLDRDGVIIENRDNYVRSLDDIIFYPQALKALAHAAESYYRIIIITNQSAVGRGIITLKQAQDINLKVVSEIEKYGGRVDGVFMCPHSPAAHCVCRKPQPGLFFQAARKFSIDMNNSIMIGDALTDILAGKAAGVPSRFLVLTGRGAAQSKLPGAEELQPFRTFETLDKAIVYLLHKQSPN